MISFDKIVKKMLRKSWKVILKEEIFEIIDPEKKPEYQVKIDKIIYKLKSQKIILSLKNWVYLVPSLDDLKLNEIDLIEKYYYQLLKKYIISNCSNEYFISWKKALEINSKNYTVPEKIFIVNRKIDKKIIFWSYQIIFKTIKGNIDWKKINLYSRLSKMVVNFKIDDLNFKTSCLELSLVESALITDNNEWIDLNLLNKTIKKYHKVFDKQKFYDIWKLKFIMSFNRLKELSKNIDRDLYDVFLDVIKINGWLFIWEWLRQI